MDKFRVGQKVRYIGPGERLPTGSVGVVVLPKAIRPQSTGPRYGVEFSGHPCPIGPGPDWYCQELHLEPIDDDADYKRFMERVMKPVDLGQPVNA